MSQGLLPSVQEPGIDLGHYSTTLLDLICYAAANKPSFREASLDLAKLSGLSVHEKQVERLGKRLGSERLAQRDEQLARFLAMPLAQRCDGAPKGVAPPDQDQVAVVMADAGMLQLRAAANDETAGANAAAADPASAVATTSEPPAPTPRADADVTPDPVAADSPNAATEEVDYDQDKPPSGRHWREDKVGLVLLMRSQVSATDPCPDIPDTFLDADRVAQIVRGLKKSAALQADDQSAQTAVPPDSQPEPEPQATYEGPKLQLRQVVASRRSWPLFGALLACAAYLAGLAKAQRKAFVADGARAIWGVWRARFSSYEPILDFIHAMTYVYEAAKAIGQDVGGGWRLYAEWITWTWQGQVGRVIEKLHQWQQDNADPQQGPATTSARNAVQRTLGYLENNQERMKYDAYRKQGLPLVSSLVESMVKQISRRVKGTEKFWGEEGAEAILQLRADYLSDGAVMADFWQRRQASATGQRSYRSLS